MLIYLFYVLNLLLLLSTFLVFRLESSERLLALSLIQAMVGLPMLAGLHIYVGYHLEAQVVPLLLFSECVFAFIWFYMAYRLDRSTVTTAPESRLSLLIQIFIGIVVAALAGYCLFNRPTIWILDKSLIFENYGSIYFCAVFLLISVLLVAWRLEKFWRALRPAQRWEYKFLVVGSYLACGALVWATSYRLTYLRFIHTHLWLLAALLLMGWFLICYAVGRHRLLNRKMFISRKIVYSFVSPIILTTYFFALGFISLIMRYFEFTLPFVLLWLLIAFGLTATGIFVSSEKLHKRLHYFISTHFYINKYEYRDEWLSFSRLLQGASTEVNVAEALRQILADSLYTTNIVIWLGDPKSGYSRISSNGAPESQTRDDNLEPDDPLVRFLQTHPYFYINDRKADSFWQEVVQRKVDYLTDLDLVIITPLIIGNQLIGLIGLGPEFTGGRYGQDDFDLLTAIGTQAASALMAVRMAEKLAYFRERQAWDKLSAFVLHDVKNAANMLALARENATDHFQDPKFQHDFLEAVDDALARMTKVQERLSMLKKEVIPEWQNLELCRFLKDRCRQLGKKLGKMKIAVDCRIRIQVDTDPKLLSQILENLLLNAQEAGSDGTVVRIKASNDEDQGQAIIEITDNGPGIPQHLLPDGLFKPYKTNKPGGSGIGLWLVKLFITSLKGTVSAENMAAGGARFVMRLPLVGVEKFNSK